MSSCFDRPRTDLSSAPVVDTQWQIIDWLSIPYSQPAVLLRQTSPVPVFRPLYYIHTCAVATQTDIASSPMHIKDQYIGYVHIAYVSGF